MQNKYHVKNGDSVEVISGNWKGEEAKITAVLKQKDRVVLELANMTPDKQKRIGRKTVKSSPNNEQRGLIERAISVHVSNVKLKV